MQSPFAIFRKHQKEMTVVLTGLAMFAFIVLAQIDAMPALVVPIMGFLVGAGLFWALSGKSGVEGGGYAFVGGILGVVMLTFVIPRFFPDTTGIKLRNGTNISQQKIKSLSERRNRANQFVQLAFQASGGEKDTKRTFPPLFDIGLPGNQYQRDVVLGYLLNLKADELNITVSDEVVTAYIRDEVTQQQLPNDRFKLVLRKLGTSETQLYDDLRSELRARIVKNLLLPNIIENKIREIGGRRIGQQPYPHAGPVLPEQLWDYYRKMNVKQSMYVTPFPVESFVDVSATPDDAELQKFFDDYKSRIPNFNPLGQPAPGAPGFRQPARIKIGYFEANLRDAEDEKRAELEAKIMTTAEIEERRVKLDEGLTALKASMSELLANNSLNKEQAAERIAESEASIKVLKAALDSKKPINWLDYEALALYESEKASKYLNENEEEPPADGLLPAPEAPVKPPSKPKPEKSSEEKPKASEKPDDKTSKPDKTSKANAVDKPKPAPEKKDKPAEPAKQPKEKSSQLSNSSTLKYVALLDEEQKKVAEKKKTEKQKTEPKQKPAAKPKQSKPETPAKQQPAAKADTKPEEPGAGDDPFPQEKDRPKYRPLDEELKDALKDEIITRHARQLMADRIKAAEKEMKVVRKKYFKQANVGLDDEKAAEAEDKKQQVAKKKPKLGLTPKERLAMMQKYATANKLKYVELEPLSFNELRELADDAKTGAAGEANADEFLIGLATEPTRGTPVIRVLFDQQQSLLLYSTYNAEDVTAGKRYAYWPIERIESHVPQLDEAGMKGQVIEAWRLQQAQPLAKEQAEKVATLVKSGKLFDPLLDLTAKQLKTVLVARGMDKATQGADMLEWLKAEIDKQQAADFEEKSTEKPPVKAERPESKTDAEPARKEATEKPKASAAKAGKSTKPDEPAEEKTDKEKTDKEKPAAKKAEQDQAKPASPEEKKELEELSRVYNNVLYSISLDEPKFELRHPGSAKVLFEWLELQAAKPKAAADFKEELATVKKALSVTGKPDGKQLAFQYTTSFSWLSQGNLQMGGRQVTLSTPENIEKPDENFMKYVFDNLKNGETGVVSNGDRSDYYLVTVENRTPVNEAAAKLFHDRFMRDGEGYLSYISPYMAILLNDQFEQNSKWVIELEKHYLADEPEPAAAP